MQVGERVRFGLLSTLFKLDEKRVTVCTSSLSSNDMSCLKTSLEKLGPQSAQLVKEWKSDVSHLVIKEGKMTIKVANALAKCIPIVTPVFFQDYLNCLETRQNLPDPKNYVPPLKESSLNANQVNLAINEQRGQVFAGKTFTFATANQLNKYKDAINFANGTTRLLSQVVCKDFSKPDNILVVSHESSNNPKYKSAQAILESAGLVAVNEQHIALAILHASCAVFCNAQHKVKIISTPKNTQTQKNKTIVQETQPVSEQISSLSYSSENFVIPETARSSAPMPTQSTLPSKIPETQRSSATLPSQSVLPSKIPETQRSSAESAKSQETPPRSSTGSAKSPQSLDDKENNDQVFKPPSPPKMSPFNHGDEDDLFNFDEDDEMPRERNKRKRSQDEENISQPKKVKSQAKSPVKAVVPESPLKSPKKEALTPPPVKIQTSGYLSKSFRVKPSLQATNSTVKSEYPEEELTKSFITLEVRPLVVKKTQMTNSMVKTSLDNTSNFKRFKKQSLVSSNRSISCAHQSMSTSNAVSILDEVVEPVAQPKRQAAEDQDFWNFDSQESRKRKRK